MVQGSLSIAAGAQQAGPPRRQRLATVVLADDAEYLRFTAAAFAAFDGAGLELTDSAVPFSLRVRPWLLEWAAERFRLRVLQR